MKLSVFNLGDAGVNLTKSPLHTEDGEWVRLQNAAIELRGAEHGIAKRAGIAPFASGMTGSVLAIINVPITPKPPPEEGPGGPPPTDVPIPIDFAFGPAALNIMRTKLYLTGATTSIADNTATTIDWTAEAWDVGNLHDLVTNPSRITVPTDGDGLYLVIAQAKWATAGNQPKKRTVRIYKNDTDLRGEASVGADDDGDSLFHQVSALVPAVATDWFTVVVEQDTGGALNLEGSGEDETWVTAIRLVASTTWQLPRCHALHSTTQTLTKDTPALIALDSEAYDVHAMHDLAVNNSRITIPATHGGLYYVSGQYARDHEAAGYVVVELLKNGATVLATSNQNFINASVDPDAAGQVSGAFEFAAGDYVEMRATYRNYAVGAGATTVLLGTMKHCSLIAARIG